MSAVIRHMVMRKRAAEAEAEAFQRRREQLIAEAKGDNGQAPAHEWDGTRLRFQNPNGTWGEWVDLRGKRGPKGDPGKDGMTFIGGGGGGRFNPASLPPLDSAPVTTDFLVLERNGEAYRVSLAQLQAILGGGGELPAGAVSVNGETITVNGEIVTVT